MTDRTSLLFVLVAALGACRGHDAREVSSARGVAARPALAHATQDDLARELDDAERHGTWNAVRARWEGQHVHWKVTRYRALCRDAAACHVAAFPVQRPAQHGWMPELAFAAGAFASIEQQCGSKEPCELEIEGTLARLSVSGDLPTSLKISDVRLAGTDVAVGPAHGHDSSD
jgi:hypothetical protein